ISRDFPNYQTAGKLDALHTLARGYQFVSEAKRRQFARVVGAVSVARLTIAIAAVLLCQVARCENILLTGATVHPVNGENLSPGQVWMKDGKIAGMGKNVSASGATSADLKGQHLYPGMIELNSVLGLIEIGAVRATQD